MSDDLQALLNLDDPRPPLPGEVDGPGLGQLYRVFLGREAEPGVLESFAARPLHDVAAEMSGSDEIGRHVLHPLVQDRPLPHEHLSPELVDELHPWVAQRLGVPSTPRAGRTLYTLLWSAFSQPTVARMLYLAHGGLFEQALRELAQRGRAGALNLVGKIEFANREFISGWMLDESGRLPSPQVEIRLQGRLLATASAYSFRPDVRQRFGGEGLAGFRAPWDPRLWPREQPLTLTLHEASSGVQVGPPYRFENSFVDQLSVAQLLAKEFEAIQQRLDVLAGMVPQALGYSAFPLEHYDLYRRVHRVPPPPALAGEPALAPAGRGFRVLLDAEGASPNAVRLSLDSLRAQQGGAAWRVQVVAGDATVNDVVALQSAAGQPVDGLAGWADAQAALSPLAGDPTQWVLLLRAGESLDPQALAWLDAAAGRSDALALYWDEDRLLRPDGRAPGRAPAHTDPVLRGAFDPDALLELNIVGTSFAARADAMEAAAALLAGHPGGQPVPPLHPADRERLVWALHAQGPWRHLPQCLLSRTPLADLDGQATGPERLVARAKPHELAPLLPAEWQDQSWQRGPDPLDSASPKALVRWAPRRPDARISVLIPTRDHVDLVRQCVDSLLDLAERPQALEILIADNGSTDPATLEYLEQARSTGRLRVLRIDEPFNWSRLNNQMARAAFGEHLLFLNNDTRMLTRDWDRHLRAQLDRPHVGAVGARLLYDDLSIQHAGIQYGYEGFVGHIGVGQAVGDPRALDGTGLTRAVAGVTGAFLACRRAVFEQVGGFDEVDLSVTFNDVEWCLRVRRSGLTVLYAPLISLIHYESKSRGFDFLSPAKQQRAEHERHRLLLRQPNAFSSDPLLSPRLSGWSHAQPALR